MKGEALVTWQNAVSIPAAQAVLTGALVGLVAGAAAVLYGVRYPVAVGIGVSGLTTLAAWLSYRRDWARRVNAVVGLVDELQAKRLESSTIRLEVITDNARAGDYIDLPGGQERLLTLASGVNAGIPFTCRSWSGKGGIYSEAEFSQLRGELIRRGLASWRSPHDNRSGVVLTCAGKAVFRHLASLGGASSPTPRGLTGYSGKSLSVSTSTHTHTEGLR